MGWLACVSVIVVSASTSSRHSLCKTSRQALDCILAQKAEHRASHLRAGRVLSKFGRGSRFFPCSRGKLEALMHGQQHDCAVPPVFLASVSHLRVSPQLRRTARPWPAQTLLSQGYVSVQVHAKTAVTDTAAACPDHSCVRVQNVMAMGDTAAA